MPEIHSAPLLKRSFYRAGGFTLGELLISIAVLALIVVFVMQVMQAAMGVTAAGHKRIDSDSQAQQVFDRMAADFDQMIKRTDVSYYFKTGSAMAGNDQIAFFTAAAGHYPQSSYNSDASLVAYRVNSNSTDARAAASYNRLERMGKGLLLNGGSTASIPLLFINSNYSTSIRNVWPAATNNTWDADYGLAGSHVIRFEYYYLLDPNGPSGFSSGLSAGPWANSDASFKIKDIAAIIVAIAAIDPRSRNSLTKAQMEILAGTNGQTSPFVDFTTGYAAGQLLSTWQTALLNDPQIAAMPRQATQNIRFYERYFPLTQR